MKTNYEEKQNSKSANGDNKPCNYFNFGDNNDLRGCTFIVHGDNMKIIHGEDYMAARGKSLMASLDEKQKESVKMLKTYIPEERELLLEVEAILACKSNNDLTALFKRDFVEKKRILPFQINSIDFIQPFLNLIQYERGKSIEAIRKSNKRDAYRELMKRNRAASSSEKQP